MVQHQSDGQNSQQQHHQPLLCPKLEEGVGGSNFSGDSNSVPTTPAVNNNVTQLQMSGTNAQQPISIFAPLQIQQNAAGGPIQILPTDPSLLERSGSLSSISDFNHPIPSSSTTSFPGATSANSGGGGSGSLTCTVCGDVATGRHYGSVACNGCKGFFRRTIRRNYKYTCRFNSNCQIDKHNRAVCRACRYARCIQYGMKVDAVQSERDLIGKRSRYSSTPGPMTNAGTGSEAASPTQSDEITTQSQFKMPSADQQQIQQQPMEHFESNAHSCSSTTSAPSQQSSDNANQSQSQSAYLSQFQFASLDNDEPIPRKRSFSSGSRFEQMVQAHVGRRQFLQQLNATKPTLPEEQQQEMTGTELDPELEDPWSGRNGRGLLRQLLCSEEKIRNMRKTVIAQTCNLEYTTKGEPGSRRMMSLMRFGGNNNNGTRKANENDILQSLHSQLLLVIEWAKTLKPFAELPTEDQTALLKNFAAQHVVLCVAYRSTSDFLKLINDSCIPRIANDDDKDLFYRKDAERVMDLLVSPMRFLRIDDVEFVAMKACILFNPVARGLTAQSVMSVLQTRRHIFRALQHYVQAKMPPDEDRIGDLTFFILSSLQSLAKAVSEDVLVSKLSGVARLDQLMEELILEDNDMKEAPMNSQQQPQSPTELGNAAVGPSQSRAPSTPQMLARRQSVGENAAAAGQLFLAAAAALSNSPIGAGGQSAGQWIGQNSPPQPNQSQQFICPSVQQRSRNLSSSASSSSNSPPLALLQPVPSTPFPPGQRGGIGHISLINESELNSSALSSYVFGGAIHGSPQQQPSAFLPNSSTNTVPPSNANVNHHQQNHCGQQQQDAPLHSVHPLSPPSSSSTIGCPTSSSSSSYNGQFFAQFRPNSTSSREGSQQQHHLPRGTVEFWPPIGSNLLFTPSTPGPAIYSGTSPSPPQRYGIGGSSG